MLCLMATVGALTRACSVCAEWTRTPSGWCSCPTCARTLVCADPRCGITYTHDRVSSPYTHTNTHTHTHVLTYPSSPLFPTQNSLHHTHHPPSPIDIISYAPSPPPHPPPPTPPSGWYVDFGVQWFQRALQWRQSSPGKAPRTAVVPRNRTVKEVRRLYGDEGWVVLMAMC